ncbi:3241_t:CDS:1, partial [Acaulospora morrowiae]
MLHVYNDLVSIIGILIIIYISHFYFKYFTRENPLPGPIPLPLVGNIFLLREDIGEWPNRLQKIYGDFYETYVGPRRIVWLCGEDLIHKIVDSSSHSNFHELTAPDNEGLKEVELLNSGVIFNLNYKSWEFYRRFYSRSILKPSFIIQATDSIQEVFNEMDNYWEQLGEDFILDFPFWTKRFFLDTIFLIATSKPAYSLASYYNSVSPDKKVHVSENNLKESDTFILGINAFVTSLIYFLMLPKYLREFPGLRSFTRDLKERLNWLRNNVRGIIKERREEIERTPENQELTHDILTMFLTINTS